jgi:spermidine synthase
MPTRPRTTSALADGEPGATDGASERPSRPRPLARGLLVTLFFRSGAAGLVYEVLWTRQLTLVFGVTTYAVATVLATFMGGLALGSHLFGRWIDRRSSPLLVYALLEAGVGAYALLVPSLFVGLRHCYVPLSRLDLPYPLFALARALLAALVLLLPTALMGGTFPVLARFWVRERGGVGRGTALLYFVNTTGAIAGCLAAGFLLIEHLGLGGTTRLAAATNLGVGALAAALAGLTPRRTPGTTAAAGRGGDALAPGTVRLVLACIGLSGFTALGYEVLWTRALLRFVYNSTYAFTTMLAAFLAGIALGSVLYAAVIRRTRQPLLAFAGLQTLVGVGFVGSAVIFPDLPQAAATILGTAEVGSFAASVGTMALRAGLILVPPTLFLGAALPAAIHLCAGGLATLGGTVGRVYAVNTLGAIAGSLATVSRPSALMQGTLALLVTINLLCGGAVAVAAAPSTGRRLAAAVVAIALLAGARLAMPGDVFRRTFAAPGDRLLFYREGATDTVGVVEAFGQRTIAYEDRRGTAGTGTHPWNFFLGHLPMLLHPGEPRRVLHICFGVGNSLSAVAAHDAVERVDSVELSPHVLETARYFWTNNDVLANPKVRTIIDDGRNFVMATRETYDVIALEPPETFTAGVINLYTREFYRDLAARLAPDGVALQWIPVGEATLDDERMLFRAFLDVFPHATAWWQLDQFFVLLIGTKEPLAIDYQRLREKMGRDRVRQDLALAGLRDVDHLLSYFTFDEVAFAEFVGGAPPATDDRTVLDFTMPRHIGTGFGFGTFSTNTRQGERRPLTVAFEHKAYYAARRRSVVPYLTNLGADTPQTVESRIAAQARVPARLVPIREERWHRW